MSIQAAWSPSSQHTLGTAQILWGSQFQLLLGPKKMRVPWVLINNLLLFIPPVSAGPAAYGVCQAGCAAVVMTCYSAAGFTWGATMGASAPASVMACNLAFGKCQAACAAVLLAPTL
jgi:hypothetical protein